VRSIRHTSAVTSTPSPRGTCRSTSVGARPGARGPPWLECPRPRPAACHPGHAPHQPVDPAGLEIARRENISVAELLAFAVVPDVAPVHLLMPPESAEPYAVTTVTLDPGPARAWIRGTKPLPGTDRRVFLTEVPDRQLPRSMPARLSCQHPTGPALLMTERQMRRRRVVVRGEGDKIGGDGHQVIPPVRFCRQAIQEDRDRVSRWPRRNSSSSSGISGCASLRTPPGRVVATPGQDQSRSRRTPPAPVAGR
jgi:hypothetical protein